MIVDNLEKKTANELLFNGSEHRMDRESDESFKTTKAELGSNISSNEYEGRCEDSQRQFQPVSDSC